MFVLIGSFALAQKQSVSHQAGGTSRSEYANKTRSKPKSSFQNDKEIDGFRLFPNPVTDGTVFIVTKHNAVKNVIIYDVLGKVVLQKQVSATYLNVSDLTSGVYILKVKEYDRTTTRKLVIK